MYGDTVYFSHDIVKRDGTQIIETKRNPSNLYDKVYFEKSLLQCAVYDVLTRFSSPVLRKSKFCRNFLNDEEIMLRRDYKYYLQIGDFRYQVELVNPHKILAFINAKTLACRGYTSAMHFDSIWKYNEFEKLKSCFKWKIVGEITIKKRITKDMIR